MNNESKVRRRLLKSVTTGGIVASAAPATWVKPVVGHVLLPAHAQTSPAEDASAVEGVFTTGTFQLAELFSPRRTRYAKTRDAAAERLLEMLVPSARADHDTAGHLCGNIEPTGTIEIMFRVPAGEGPKDADVCIESNNDNSGLCRVAKLSTLDIDLSLSDVDSDLPTNSDSHTLDLRNMTASGTA